ncbi:MULTISPECIES: GTPase HflX [unclassified Arthrobacter]|uniref:GTPase HflX n=1 Tax=unclassified Arthrobacter TaxID=235627 RepID=UPI001E58430D|nr:MULTISPECIES: GTPase HflX [unclassified Arthrobacter]MCC9146303.1 GTPase HflX [Arthrobacter sp. zg-Y919]MDK1277533.1 GTPase HflX [Arthrobacter sp. zg.Y919]MDM7990325.1 GTPase HflX [Arthrobacter sp. zg-Y877]WIB04016.1 GTPase HflX [Arthrobacter sp. zg-Y919]
MTIHNPRATSSDQNSTPELSPSDIQGVIDRILAKDTAVETKTAAAGDQTRGRALALSDDDNGHSAHDGEQQDLEERRALRRVAGLSTELEDVTEVEYRQLRLERVVLAGLWSEGTSADAENSLKELAALAETAGSEVLDGIIQRRQKPDPGTFLGSGKAQELKEIVMATGADTVIVDSELAPSQRRGLEDIVKVKVIDRTALILDIFAQHAKSREGKAQVELAQLEYLLPRLRGWGESMSRQAGGQVGSASAGMGSRGPGETKIELDRRKIRTRMAKLRREIAAMKPARETKRANRHRNSVPSVAIAGYTNAGKSSLLNRLTDAGVLVENALFATLDPTIRKAQTEDGIGYTLADTVGFVRSLPTQLVEAFRSTLEEVADADLILHVVDASHPDPEGQIAAVRTVLAEVDARKVPEIIVLNKADAADPFVLERLRQRESRHVVVSARTGEGIPELMQAISEGIPRPGVDLELLVPYERGDVVSRLHQQDAEILALEHGEEGTRLHVKVREGLAAELEPFVAHG